MCWGWLSFLPVLWLYCRVSREVAWFLLRGSYWKLEVSPMEAALPIFFSVNIQKSRPISVWTLIRKNHSSLVDQNVQKLQITSTPTSLHLRLPVQDELRKTLKDRIKSYWNQWVFHYIGLLVLANITQATEIYQNKGSNLYDMQGNTSSTQSGPLFSVWEKLHASTVKWFVIVCDCPSLAFPFSCNVYISV